MSAPEWDPIGETFDPDPPDEPSEPDEYEDPDPHELAHRWYHAGCADCDLRADWIEAGRP